MAVCLAQNIAIIPPKHTPEEWAAIDAESRRWEQEQRDKETQCCLNRAGIPSDYRDADIGLVKDARIKAWAKNPTVGLILSGEPGRGKTYAACAVLREFAKRKTVMFSSLRDMLRNIRATFDSYDSEQSVLSRYFKSGLLCLDDMGKEKLTDWGAEKAFSVIDERIAEGRPTIITSNYGWDDMLRKTFGSGDTETVDSMASRLSMFEFVEVVGEDRRQS